MSVAERFLRYVKVDTPSDEHTDGVTPSSACQFDLANMLVDELKALGVENAHVDEKCYVYASIPANCPAKYSIGFIAHVDVVNDTKGWGVNPQITKNYDGGDLVLKNGVVIKASDFPALKKYVGHDVITTDGTTILGADDKAGIAEIMQAVEYIMAHPEFKHGKIGIAFTPDEEIGNGASGFDVKKFGCDFAYTIDGEELGELSYETFNGAGFSIDINGVNIHPGKAKGKMINALVVANEIINSFPVDERPETTDGRQGYYFFNEIKGSVESCALAGIVRDHDRGEFERRKQFVKDVVASFNQKYGDLLTLKIKDQYYNCAPIISEHIHLIDNAKTAMLNNGIEPIVTPVRGGTDGSGLSFMGLPCPNICTGGLNAHGVKECISAQAMQKVVDVVLDVISLYAKN